MGMKLFKMYFTPEQLEFLGELKKETGIPVSEAVRRALNAFIESKKIARQSCFGASEPGRGEEI